MLQTVILAEMLVIGQEGEIILQNFGSDILHLQAVPLYPHGMPSLVVVHLLMSIFWCFGIAVTALVQKELTVCHAWLVLE